MLNNWSGVYWLQISWRQDCKVSWSAYHSMVSATVLDVITELWFANDATLYATSEESFVTVTQSFVEVVI